MDILFILFTIITFIILTLLFYYNFIPKTSNLSLIFTNLTKSDATIKAFCLGYDAVRNKYVNVYPSSETGKMTISYQNQPVNLQGQFVNQNTTHGQVSYDENGIRISGFDTLTLTCPDGYEGNDCRLTPLCLPEEEGIIKGLTANQFNALHLYNDGQQFFPIEKIALFSKDTISPFNLRIRVACLADGEYQLQTCSDDKILDQTTFQCVPYDICQDLLAGTKHNSIISKDQPPLKNNEYYVCKNNTSVLMTCEEDTLYSEELQACIYDNPCFGKDDLQIPIDSQNYIQCSDDRGTKINCPDGIDVDDNGIMACKNIPCEEYPIYYEDDILKYANGKMVCVDNKPVLKSCDLTVTTKVLKYYWGYVVPKLEHEINLYNWPEEIYNLNTNVCEKVKNFEPVKDGATIDFQISDALVGPFPWDIKNEIYKCDDTTKYTMKYWGSKLGETSNVIPNPESVTPGYLKNYFVDGGHPCRNEITKYVDAPWQGLNAKPVFFPGLDGYSNLPLMFIVPHSFNDAYGWPRKENDGNYTFYTCDYDYSSRRMIRTKFTSKYLPLGYTSSIHSYNNINRLLMEGVNSYNNGSIIDKYIPGIPYILKSGKISKVSYPNVYKPSDYTKTEKIYECPKELRTVTMIVGQKVEMFVLWNNIKPGETFKLSNEITITENGMQTNEGLLQKTWSPLTFERTLLGVIIYYQSFENRVNDLTRIYTFP